MSLASKLQVSWTLGVWAAVECARSQKRDYSCHVATESPKRRRDQVQVAVNHSGLALQPS